MPGWVGGFIAAGAGVSEKVSQRQPCLPAPPPAASAGGDDGYAAYEARLAAACAPYRHVIFIGDSMGATGALLFAHLASDVQAWTPQVDLATSSIRWDGVLRGCAG